MELELGEGLLQNQMRKVSDTELCKLYFAAALFFRGKGRNMSRREIREHIFRMLFGIEFYNEEEMKEQMDLYFEEVLDDDLDNHPSFVSGEDQVYIKDKAAKVAALVPQLDECINSVATGWKTGRMGKADLTILRLAVYEMKYDDTIPVGVAINEAVELAKKFGSDESSAFVNGILAKLV